MYSVVLQKAIDEGLKMPSVKTKFDSIVVYRMANYNEYPAPLSRSHFNSQAENSKKPKGNHEPWEEYTCSCYTDCEVLKTRTHLPRKGCKIAKGTIYSIGGALLGPAEDSHCHWFLYNDYDPSIKNFKEVNDESIY